MGKTYKDRKDIDSRDRKRDRDGWRNDRKVARANKKAQRQFEEESQNA